MYKLLTFLLPVCFLCSCTQPQSQSSEESAGKEHRIKGQKDQKPPSETKQWLAPVEKVSDGERTVPVYDWAHFEPIIHQIEDDSVYIVNFWATWCKPCVEELPHFIALAKKYESHKVHFIFVSLDFRNAVETSLLPFLHKKPLPGTVLLLHEPDANAWIDQVHPSWSGAIPATLMLKKKNMDFYEKAFSFDDLEKAYLKIKDA